MIKHFNEDGVSFHYPADWTLEREDGEHGWTVSLQSPNTAFLMVCLRDDHPDTDQLVGAALETLKEDYPDLEADARTDTVAGQLAVGHDIRFFSLDLTNTCWTGSFYTARGTVLVLCQSSDLDLERSEPVLRAICASLQLEDD